MNWPCSWEMLLITLWIQVGFVPGIHCKDGTVNHLSREDVLLLKDEQDPKCFTRTQDDFTCFFETADNRTYDFLYVIDRDKRCCDMSVQATEEGTFLHICSFPARDVFLFINIYLEVKVHNTSTILYSRTVAVEDHILPDPPFNVSLQENGQAEQLQVSWHTFVSKYFTVKVKCKIRYPSKGLGEERKDKNCEVLDSLVPGEEVEVQISVRHVLNENAGHWSSWSHPVQAVVPQRADDISLMCYTSDMQNITCQWNASRYGVEKEYKLFYKMGLSEASSWTNWNECPADGDLTDLCRFRGDESRKVLVKLSGTPGPLSRTFFFQKFTLNNSIKTSPPSRLRGALEKDKLCLKWDAPLQSLSAHLQYEVGYQIRGGEAMMTGLLNSPETATCLDVPTGGWYSVKLRTKPSGSIYSGQWSDWSDVHTVDPPTNIDRLLMLCIPVPLVITGIIFLSLIYTHLSKLKQYFWPPVPNLDKVLQGFLTEINGQRWNPPIMAKQCSEETTSSVVEVMSEDFSGLGKPSEEFTELLSPESGFSSSEHVDGRPGTEVFPDYVTLSKDSVIVCPNGNYIYKQVGEKEGPEVRDELLQTCHSSCTNGLVCTPPYLGTDFLNHSYLTLTEPADKFNCKVTGAKRPGNLYTNFPSN